MRHIFKSLAIAGALILHLAVHAQDVSPELREYVARFYKEADSRGIPFSSNIKAIKFPDSVDYALHQFDTRKPKWAGVAVLNNITRQWVVFINKQSFVNSDDTGREMLVFHELIHAYFSMKHIEGNCLMGNDGLQNCDAWFYKQNRKQVLNEVFTIYKTIEK